MRTTQEISEEIKDICKYAFVEGYELSQAEQDLMYEDIRQQVEWALDAWQEEIIEYAKANQL